MTDFAPDLCESKGVVVIKVINATCSIITWVNFYCAGETGTDISIFHPLFPELPKPPCPGAFCAKKNSMFFLQPEITANAKTHGRAGKPWGPCGDNESKTKHRLQ